MEKRSWVFTLFIQLCLCVALYCALNLGQPQTPSYRIGIQSPSKEIYFISVRGGFRPLKEQIDLLRQMGKVLRTYKVGFLINISDLGEDDPLLQNATRYFRPSKAPWYTTGVLRADEPGYFLKRVNISKGKTLDVIALDTQSMQDSSNGSTNVQLQWLTKALESSNSNWHIAVGFHPLLCNRSLEQTHEKQKDFVHQILVKHGVDAYLSGQSCADEAHMRRPHFTILSQSSRPPKEMANMFLLHRVSPLEIATYGVSLRGDIVHESTIKQRGREVM